MGVQAVPRTTITKTESAAVLPNNRGGRSVHNRTIDRRVDRRELPAYDWKFSDGTCGWNRTTLESAGFAAFIESI